ncbi:DUF445 family protein [Pelotomaculum sp. PtaB.Bin117]|uniref:DUF445 family protein n=1 Tax=Pelotomaculum sp. PtaB.Bin117 TaxID=1811694 RepID=UPI0009D54408|nr:DUF445 family protein [Pelotomaculum sp. PtaB.Bin117]OPX90153.1 MAG: hypothetical protein A4E54_00727 [Pelotomaculum sp. PtaB.Bin117]
MDTLLVLLKNIILSTLHGWVGASLAVFMFFRPLKPWRIGRVRIWQGVIPAQQTRIAEAVSDVVSRDLLTPQALFDYLVREQALDRRVRSTMHDLVALVSGNEYPSVESMFPPQAAGLKEELKIRVKEALARWAVKYLTDPGVEAWLRDFLHRQLKRLWQKKAGELWPEERAEATLRRFLENAAVYLSGPEFRDAASRLIEQAHVTLRGQTMPLRDVLPQPLKDKVAEWPARLAQVLPELIMRLRDNEEVQERLTAVILDIMEQLKGKGLLARVSIGLFQFFSEYRAEVESFVRNDMFPRLGEFLSSPEMRMRLEQYIREQADAILDRPVGELAGGLDPGQLAQASDWLAARLGGWLAGAGAQAWPNEFLLGRYRAMAGYTVAELCGRYAGVTPEKVEASLSRHGLDLLRRPVTMRFVRLAARSLVEEIAKYPVGRLRDRFSPETLEKVEVMSAGMITAYLKNKIPSFLEELDLKTIVKTRIESYSTRELVDMFQRVTMNSLQKIEIYGAVIGAVMGVFFGLANLRSDAFWFIAALLAFIIGLIRYVR